MTPIELGEQSRCRMREGWCQILLAPEPLSAQLSACHPPR